MDDCYTNYAHTTWRESCLAEIYHFFCFQARVALYKNGSEILSIVFNATKSCNENWFSRERITHSPWNDLYTEPIIMFYIRGQVKRAFDISRNHGGCWKNAGWLMVSSNFCFWEERLPKSTIMYSNITSYTQFKKIGKKLNWLWKTFFSVSSLMFVGLSAVTDPQTCLISSSRS